MKITGISTAYKGFCSVQHVTVEKEDGSTHTMERVVRKPAVIAVCHDPINDQVMLVEQYRFGAMQNVVEWPAGLVDEGEEEHMAVLREVLEETGVIAKSATLLYSYLASPGLQWEPIQVFYVTFDSREVESGVVFEGEGLESTRVIIKSAKELIKEVEQNKHKSLSVIAGAQYIKMLHHRLAH